MTTEEFSKLVDKAYILMKSRNRIDKCSSYTRPNIFIKNTDGGVSSSKICSGVPIGTGTGIRYDLDMLSATCSESDDKRSPKILSFNGYLVINTLPFGKSTIRELIQQLVVKKMITKEEGLGYIIKEDLSLVPVRFSLKNTVRLIIIKTNKKI